jgi:hypothetical protein
MNSIDSDRRCAFLGTDERRVGRIQLLRGSEQPRRRRLSTIFIENADARKNEVNGKLPNALP